MTDLQTAWIAALDRFELTTRAMARAQELAEQLRANQPTRTQLDELERLMDQVAGSWLEARAEIVRIRDLAASRRDLN